MSHKTLSRILLLAGVIACIGGAAVFFLYAPAAAFECRDMYPELSYLCWPMLCYVWLIALMYIHAVIRYMRISLRLGKNRSFCTENAADLKGIAVLLTIAAGLWFALIFLPGLAGAPVGPAFLLFLLACMATLAVAMVAWVLSLLVRRAAELQDENDLTI